MAQTWNLYQLVEPQQVRAGYSGSERTPFYFDCGECEAKEPIITGYIATEPTFTKIAVRRTPDGFFRAQYLCATCFAKHE